MNIVNVNINEIIPYEKNPRINDHAVEYVANSIKEFGFKVPVVLDKNNVIVTGHTRIKACEKLGIKEIPCIYADDLTEEQVKAFRLADNKVGEIAQWDFDLLDIELDDILDIDMQDFGFQDEILDTEDFDIKHDIEQKNTQKRVENILNLGMYQAYSDNKYDFPQLEPVFELDDIKEWIPFNKVLSDKNPKGKGVHFFIDDYQFERIWKYPQKYVEKLKEYVCVATPDFSPYGDMPLIAQMWNHYRKLWVGSYLQENGVTVISTIRASTDERSLEWFLMGEPKGGCVIYSTMWTKNNENIKCSQKEYDLMKEVLKPCKIFLYGGYGGIKTEETDCIECIKSYAQERWNKNGERK